MNLIDWLSTPESYTSLTQVLGLQLDTSTALLPFETPQLSTEPQPEPWASPASGYKWWDASTFKNGSYGASSGGQNPSGNPSITHPASLTAGTPFDVTIAASGLTPNSSITLQIGVYLTSGGLQVGQVQQPNGSWPTGYGYQNVTLTADGSGTAVKTIQMRTQSGKSGAANIRLRKDSSNVYHTNPVTIAP